MSQADNLRCPECFLYIDKAVVNEITKDKAHRHIFDSLN